MTEQPIKITKLKVGLTVFVGLLIFFVLITLVGTDEYYFEKTYNLYIYLDDVSGIVKGAPVTLGGYKIGSVESVELIPTGDNTNNIRMKLRLLKNYNRQITTGSFAQVTGLGVLGDKFVNITIGRAGESPLPDNAVLKVSQGKTLDDITKSLSPAITDLNKILANVREITDSVARGNGTVSTLINKQTPLMEFSKVMTHVNSVLSSIESQNGTLGSLMKNKELYNNLTEASANLKSLSVEIKHGHGTLSKLINNDSLYNNVNATSLEVKKIIGKINNDSTVVNGLLSDKKLYGDLNTMIQELNKLIIDLKAHPDKYVKFSIF